MSIPVLRTASALLVALALLAGCTRGEADPTPEAAETCQELVGQIVATLQAYVDQFAGMDAEEFVTHDPDVDLPSRAHSLREQAADLGCDPVLLDRLLAGELVGLRGEGSIAEAIAASVRLELLGEPSDRVPGERRVGPDDDLARVVAELGPGSTLLFAPGDYLLEEPLVLTRSINLVGSDRETTRLVSTAEGVALLYIGEGELRFEGITLTHRGETPASLLAVGSGALTVRGARFTAAVQGEDGTGGIGLLLGSPDSGQDPALGAVEIRESEFRGNQAAGIAVGGRRAPTITRNFVRDNGGCGVCYLEEAGGVLRGNLIASNEVGVLVEESAVPLIEDNHLLAASTAGVLYRDGGGGILRGNVVGAGGEVGILVTATAIPRIEQNRVSDQEVAGIGLVGRTRATVTGNRVTGGLVGIDLADEADPSVRRNEILDTSEAGIRIGERAGGVVAENTISGSVPVGIVILGSAGPELEANVLTNQGVVGLLYLQEATGTARSNQLEGQVVGIQVEGSARPRLARNTLRGQTEAAVAFIQSGRGEARENTCQDVLFGIVLLDDSDPILADNDCQVFDGRD